MPDRFGLHCSWHGFLAFNRMSLALYKKKRSFTKTPEPEGRKAATRGALKFVIQKHDATSLHYDLRLEMEGVLKSWAVPKGPSLNPEDKRLAMMVEDHPFDYRNFEGIIPEGEYGGGTVIVWDEGYYTLMDGEDLSRKEQEKQLLKQLKSGNLKIVFHGKKIRGAFALFLMKSRGEKSWILMKKNDRYASESDVLKKNKSVHSGKTLAQVARANGVDVKHPEGDEKRTAVKQSRNKKAGKAVAGSSGFKPRPVKELLKGSAKLARRSAMPSKIKPMLATLGDEAFDNQHWIFEIKWDGYRAVAVCNGSEVELLSRNLNSFTETYAPVKESLSALKYKAVFDGEIVAVNEKGMAVFQALQNWQNTPVHLQYFIFDLLWLDGYDLTALPLMERKRILKAIIPENNAVIQYSDHIETDGKQFFNAAIAQGLEGIMAKKADSTYHINSRSSHWLKIKANLRQEVVICGFTEPRNSRKYFGALMLGVYEGKELVYVGHTGSGFDTKTLEAVHKKLKPLVTDQSPFKTTPRGNAKVTWVKPRLVCEIKFTEWTKDRMARHPIFMGLRSDKKPKEVIFEKAAVIAELEGRKEKSKSRIKEMPASKSKKAAHKKSGSKNMIQVDPGEGEDQIIRLNKQELKLTNLNKLYWKKEKFSKGDMINYYLQIAPYIMPYMKDRPQSLNRHPNGIDGSNFFQKNQKDKLPGWMQTHADFSESTNKTIEYLVCSNEASLIYMANLGCIEMNPWHARSQSWQYPDWCLIDLDPDDSNSFDQVMEVAKTVKKILDAIGAEACCKTSGSTGIHIYIPLGARYDYDQSKQLAELVVTLVNHEMPHITSMERKPAKRKGKIYLDYLQNRETQTAAAPYSLRPKPGMPVSTPIHWSELKKGLNSKTWNALNIFERLKVEGDLFAPVLKKGIDLDKVLRKLSSIIQ